VNRLFVVGVLTEVEEVSDGVIRARVVDPTGAFVIYAGQYQPDALAFFERAHPPVFVAVTGKARTFQPEGSDRVFTSIRPESVNEVDAPTRDRWVVQTAEQTLERVAIFGKALEQSARGTELQALLRNSGVQPGITAGIPRAIEEYGTTTGYLDSIREMAIDAARLVADEIDAVDREAIAPDEGGEVPLDTSFTDVALAADSGITSGAREGADAAAQPESAAAEAQADSAGADASESTAVDDTAESSLGDEPTEDETPAESAAGTEPAGSEEGAEATGSTEGAAATDEPAAQPAEGDEPPEAADAEATDEMYELSEEERAEVKENFDVGFESGAEIGEPESEPDEGEPAPSGPDAEGESTETAEKSEAEATPAQSEAEPTPAEPEAEEEAEPEEEPTTTETGAATEAAELESEEVDDQLAGEEEREEPEEPAAEGGGDVEAAEPADESAEAGELSDEELEDVVVATMSEEGGDDGIDRETLVEIVQGEYGVDEAAIESAIQDALLGGRCFESGENRLKPI
jgi:hypothetical protein